MEAQSQKSSGLNLNPLVPAQSNPLLHFAEKLEIPSKMCPFQLVFSFMF